MLTAGCIDPPVNWDRDGQVREGTGFRTVIIDPRAAFEVVEAGLSPDGQTVGLLSSNGAFQLWSINGTMVRAWQMGAAPLQCAAAHGCGIFFLPNGTLLSFIHDNVTVLSTEGQRLWNWTPPVASEGIHWMEPAENGTLLALSYNNGSAAVHSTLTGEDFPIPVSGNMRGADISASDTASIVGTAGNSTRFYNPSGDLVAEVPRIGDVEVAGDGRAGFVWQHPFQRMGLLMILNLTVSPGTAQNWAAPHTSDRQQPGQDTPDRLFVSSNGRFAAVHAQFWVSGCSGDVCNSQPRDYVQVVDVADLQRDLGFGAVMPIRVFLADNGSAFAVSSVFVEPNVWRLEFTFADAGATPPELIPPPPVV